MMKVSLRKMIRTGREDDGRGRGNSPGAGRQLQLCKPEKTLLSPPSNVLHNSPVCVLGLDGEGGRGIQSVPSKELKGP
jgi:hypothetical protein